MASLVRETTAGSSRVWEEAGPSRSLPLRCTVPLSCACQEQAWGSAAAAAVTERGGVARQAPPPPSRSCSKRWPLLRPSGGNAMWRRHRGLKAPAGSGLAAGPSTRWRCTSMERDERSSTGSWAGAAGRGRLGTAAAAAVAAAAATPLLRCAAGACRDGGGLTPRAGHPSLPQPLPADSGRVGRVSSWPHTTTKNVLCPWMKKGSSRALRSDPPTSKYELCAEPPRCCCHLA